MLKKMEEKQAEKIVNDWSDNFDKIMTKNREELIKVIKEQQEFINRQKDYIEIYNQQVKNNQIILEKTIKICEELVKENSKHREDKEKENKGAMKRANWFGLVFLIFIIVLVVLIFKVSSLK